AVPGGVEHALDHVGVRGVAVRDRHPLLPQFRGAGLQPLPPPGIDSDPCPPPCQVPRDGRAHPAAGAAADREPPLPPHTAPPERADPTPQFRPAEPAALSQRGAGGVAAPVRPIPLHSPPMFGSHLSISGNLSYALREAESLKMDTVQIFTKN